MLDVRRGDFEQTRDHWWWRPGWGPGARYATFHLTFECAPELAAEAARLGPALARIGGVDVVPPPWLHLTMTGVGFTDQVDARTLSKLTDVVFDQLSRLTVDALVLNSVFLGREGLSLVTEPAPWLDELKVAQEHAVADALNLERQPPAPFHPHVSLAYFSGAVDLTALQRAIEVASPRPLVVERPAVSLIELGRDERMYTWRVLDQRTLG